MELPTCPSCGQSVLDDDAENCPFCGASMSQEPSSSGGGSAPPVRREKPESGGTSAPPVRRRKKGTRGATAPPVRRKATENEELDPISADAQAVEAIRARPKRTKSASMKVVCPMCETEGWVPPSAAGKDVRCPSSACMVPVFTAPKLESDSTAEEAESTAGGRSTLIFGSVFAGMLLVAGVLVYVFVIARPEEPPAGGAPPVARNGQRPDEADPQDDPGAEVESETKGTARSMRTTRQAQMTTEEIRSAAVSRMRAAVLKREGDQSKPRRRRVASVTFARTGDLEQAREQLARLKDLSGSVSVYEVVPLVEIAWGELGLGNATAARQAADEAWNAAEDVVRYKQDGVDATMRLASLMVALDRVPDARSILEREFDDEDDVHTASLLGLARTLQSYDVHEFLRRRAANSGETALEAFVTADLVSRGQWEEAVAWATGQPGARVRTQCLVACLDAVAVHAKQRLAERTGRLSEAVPPAEAALVTARSAWWQAGREGADVEQLLSRVDAQLSEIGPVEPASVPDLRAVYEGRFTTHDELRAAAMASLERARTEQKLGRTDAAWKAVEEALRYTRGMAPSPLMTLPVLREATSTSSRQTVRARLERTLGIGSDRSRAALSEYRKQVRRLHEAAGTRFRLQLSLLRHALDWGLAEQVWTEVQQRWEATAPAEREPFLRTTLPSELVAKFEETGRPELAEEVRAALHEASLSPPESLVSAESRREAEQGNVDVAARLLARHSLSPPKRQLLALALVGRLVEEKGGLTAFRFLMAFDETRQGLLRESGVEFLVRQLSQDGQADAAWELVSRGNALTATETVMACHGLLLTLPHSRSATDAETRSSE